MARLILDEGGQRRAFKVRDGKLTVGSGEGCTLKLSSPDVADVHAEIVVQDGVVAVVPKPGVLPPKVGGKAVSAKTVLSNGQRFDIGSAHFQVEYEEADKPAAAAGAAGSGGASGGPAVRRSSGGGTRPRVQRTRRTVQKGIPTWLMLVLIGGGLLVGGFAIYAYMGSLGETLDSPVATYNEAVKSFKEGAHQHTKAKLALIDMTHEEVTPDLRKKIEDLKKRVEESEADDKLFEHNRKGTEYLATQLKRFVDDRLQGEPDPAKVRVFLLRCREFRERWPQHPELDWVTRYESRFKGLADITRPPSYEDIAFEVKTLTWAMPRNYIKAFKILADFRSSASPEDQEKADELVTTLKAEQEEYFTDRMYQAKYEWDNEEHGKAVGWLVELIIGVSEASMRQQAADELVKLPGIDDWFKSYKEHQPEKFDKLVAHPTVQAKARQVGVL